MKNCNPFYTPFHDVESGRLLTSQQLPKGLIGESFLAAEDGSFYNSIFPIDHLIEIKYLRINKLDKKLKPGFFFVGDSRGFVTETDKIDMGHLPQSPRRNLQQDNIFFSVEAESGASEFKALIGDVLFLTMSDFFVDQVNDTHIVFADTPIFNGRYLRIPTLDFLGNPIRNDLDNGSPAHQLLHDMSLLDVNSNEYKVKKDQYDDLRLSEGAIRCVTNEDYEYDIEYISKYEGLSPVWTKLNQGTTPPAPSTEIALQIMLGNVTWEYSNL